ncbi:HD domain-containing phosphohydrolase [Deefgea salmonis]|uniref:HAMP domain-containing protein n=1 Tax=Deefgea salmonis TaxID=2875502 RepID=A0ABS8BMU6_9NEIS|nr:HD domain-containing phosphohydrolase [Deefgea salmonis]MCB5197045.1 HAMP domain-containing protein [Deefgea salmonis]
MRSQLQKSKHIPFHLHLGYFFVGLMVLFAGVTTWFFQNSTEKILMLNAQNRVNNFAKVATDHLDNLYRNAAVTAELMADQRIVRATTLEQRLDSMPYLLTALRTRPTLAAVYVGYPNGDFFLLRPWRNEAALIQRFNPPKNTAWIAQSIEVINGHLIGRYLFFDQNAHLIENRIKPDYQFDPRSRTWFKAAQSHVGVQSSLPYVFYTTDKAGVTISMAANQQSAVVGVDVRLETIEAVLSYYQETPGSKFLLMTADTGVMLMQDGLPNMQRTEQGQLRLPLLAELKGDWLNQLKDLPLAAGTSITMTTQGEQWAVSAKSIAVLGGASLQLWLASPHSELLGPAIEIRNRALVISALLLVLGVSLALWLARMASRPLIQLNSEAQRIARFDFSEPIQVEARITEIIALAKSMDQMKGTIEDFLHLSNALAAETNFQRLLVLIVSEMRKAALAPCGILYLAEPKQGTLEVVQAQNNDQIREAFGELATLKLEADQTHPVLQLLQQQVSSILLTPEQVQLYFNFVIAEPAAYQLVGLPLKDKSGQLLGVLALLLTAEEAITAKRLSFVTALSGTAAVALNTQRLIEEQKVLLEAFIQLLAGAIDAKSPYTGGHCQRVPELTKMLANAACQTTIGPYADFNLTETEREALHIACWLHDCGKVTTPEYVVDKATKLETLYDRLHEVRMRFEVLKRDAQIQALQAQIEGADPQQSAMQLAQALAQLDDDFAFIAQCNQGGEFMAEDKIVRLNAIAQRQWLRTLDDRIGISHEENSRKAREPAAELPVFESLLADKVEHQFTRSPREQMPAINPWGFQLKVPELLYNRGEIYNLSVARGTLSEEERYKINEHIVQTIIMLEKLPFPRHLQQVPEIAGGHHEKMDGTGYPRKLTQQQMSPLARMMAIADIFEALTAVDRPYKKGKLLSEAIRIMQSMVENQHIDRELFQLFLTSGVYLKYAKQFMQAEQIDAVAIEAYLSTPVSSA